MAAFTSEEYADMLLAYGSANTNSREARRFYQERYPNRRVPSHQTFASTYRRLRQTGNLNLQEPRVNAARPDATIDEQVLAEFDADPTKSIRQIASILGLSIWKVWSVLRQDGRHAFHYTPVQGVSPGYQTQPQYVQGPLQYQGQRFQGPTLQPQAQSRGMGLAGALGAGAVAGVVGGLIGGGISSAVAGSGGHTTPDHPGTQEPPGVPPAIPPQHPPEVPVEELPPEEYYDDLSQELEGTHITSQPDDYPHNVDPFQDREETPLADPDDDYLQNEEPSQDAEVTPKAEETDDYLENEQPAEEVEEPPNAEEPDSDYLENDQPAEETAENPEEEEPEPQEETVYEDYGGDDGGDFGGDDDWVE